MTRLAAMFWTWLSQRFRRVTPDQCAFTLDDLLAEVTDENRHDEVDWGPSVGKEAW
jgi:antitoxin component of MazEF toxin-antitoxin module